MYHKYSLIFTLYSLSNSVHLLEQDFKQNYIKQKHKLLQVHGVPKYLTSAF